MERREQRGDTLQRYRKAKRREAWLVARAQVEQQQMQASERAVFVGFAMGFPHFP